VQGRSEVDMAVYRCSFRGGGRSEVDLAVYRLAFRGGGQSEVDLVMDRPVRVFRGHLLHWADLVS
jgi:hypothetical protein